jgi:hypothetical protein
MSLATAGSAQANVLVLGPQQLDIVTAGGTGAAVDSSAAGAGSFNMVKTTGNAVTTAVQGSDPAIVATFGAAAGTATALGIGSNGSTDTSVSTSGSADGTFVVNRSFGWTLQVLSGQASGGFTWNSGRIGAFLLGGP